MASINIKLNVDDSKLKQVLAQPHTVKISPQIQQTMQQQQQIFAKQTEKISAATATVGAAGLTATGIGAVAGIETARVLKPKKLLYEPLLSSYNLYLSDLKMLDKARDSFVEKLKNQTRDFLFLYNFDFSERQSNLVNKARENFVNKMKNQLFDSKKFQDIHLIYSNLDYSARDILKIAYPKLSSKLKLIATYLPKTISDVLNYAGTITLHSMYRLDKLKNNIVELMMRGFGGFFGDITESINKPFRMLNTVFKTTLQNWPILLTGAATGALLYLTRQTQQAFEKSISTASSIRSAFTNISPNLFSNYGMIRDILQKEAVQFGVPFEEIMKAIEVSIPGTNQSLKQFQEIAKVFSQLKFVENITPEQFMELAKISQISGKSLAEVGQMFNMFTDSVKEGSEQVLTQLRRLADDFSYDIPSLFAALETMAQLKIDPREITQVLRSGVADYKKYLEEEAKYFELLQKGLIEEAEKNAPQMTEAAATIYEVFFGNLQQQFQEALQKYTTATSEDLQKSFEQLKQLPAGKLELFFGRKREEIKSELYNYAERSLPSLEMAYLEIDKFIKTKLPANFQPLLKPLFFSPETGAPTFLTALIPTMNNIATITEGVKIIVDVLTKTKNWFTTAQDFYGELAKK